MTSVAKRNKQKHVQNYIISPETHATLALQRRLQEALALAERYSNKLTVSQATERLRSDRIVHLYRTIATLKADGWYRPAFYTVLTLSAVHAIWALVL